MSRSIQIRCAVCDTLKRETNHWLLVDDANPGEYLVFRAEAVPDDVATRYKDVCGERCAVRLMSRWCSCRMVVGAGGGR